MLCVYEEERDIVHTEGQYIERAEFWGGVLWLHVHSVWWGYGCACVLLWMYRCM